MEPTSDPQTDNTATDHKTASTSISELLDRYDAEERAKALKALDAIRRIYMDFAARGGDHIRITYCGSGDEGFIDEITGSPEAPWDDMPSTAVTDELEATVYCILSWQCGGWQDNAGASGVLTVNADGVSIEHARNLHAVCESKALIQFNGTATEVPFSTRFIIDPYGD